MEDNYSDYINELRARINSGYGLTPEDIETLSSMVEDNHGITSPGNFNMPTIEGYAKYLKNYLYTYKDEATQIDPTIDPNEEHIGPMAQDIEQVAPDCIKETKEGVKTVDGNRLALINAGLLGDMSRRMLELERRILTLEEKLYG